MTDISPGIARASQDPPFEPQGEEPSQAQCAADITRSSLLQVLVASYADFRKRLAIRLGSTVLAEDVLQDTYLRLEGTPELGIVRSPRAYLLRMAVNLATDRRRSESRLLSTEEVRSLLDLDDGQPGPEKIVESRAELAVLERVLQELPPRRREILLASRVEETPHRELARRFGVSTRTIEIELKRALEHCSARLSRRAVQRFGPGAGQSS